MTRQSPQSTDSEIRAEEMRAKLFDLAPSSTLDKLRHVQRYLSRMEVGKFLAYSHLLEETSGIAGSIADCGVFEGAGLFNYANLVDLLEPYNYQCKIYGFDTFLGDSEIVSQDIKGSQVDRTKFTYKIHSKEALQQAIDIYEKSKTLPHFKRIHLIEGDLCATAPDFTKENPHVFWRIIHLSVNLYQPTLATLRNFIPRLSAGGIVVIHGLNFTTGASIALHEFIEEYNLRISATTVIPYYPNVVYLRLRN